MALNGSRVLKTWRLLLRAIRCLVILAAVSLVAQAKDCSVSKEFHLNNPQLLAGVLEDTIGTWN
jgi:hypothetical protein